MGGFEDFETDIDNATHARPESSSPDYSIEGVTESSTHVSTGPHIYV